MGIVVRLASVLEVLEYPEDWECFLDRGTGRVIAITDNEAPYLEDQEAGAEADIARLPEWQRDSIIEARQALKSADLVRLPTKFDVHEWDILRSFSDSRDEPERSDLLDAIHGRGAFRAFRRIIDELELRDEWFKYRNEALKQIAREWLSDDGIAFVED